MPINLKKSTDLTERQQALINELEREFTNINRNRIEDSSSLFAHVVLQQDIEIEQTIAEEMAARVTVIDHLKNDFIQTKSILSKDLNKLNIPFYIQHPDANCVGGYIRIGEHMVCPKSFRIKFLANATRKSIHGTGYDVILPKWSYELYENKNNYYTSIELFTKNEYFLKTIRTNRK